LTGLEKKKNKKTPPNYRKKIRRSVREWGRGRETLRRGFRSNTLAGVLQGGVDLRKEGVPCERWGMASSFNRTLWGRWNEVEKKIRKVPLSGDLPGRTVLRHHGGKNKGKLGN